MWQWNAPCAPNITVDIVSTWMMMSMPPCNVCHGTTCSGPGCHVKTMNLKICDPNNVSKKVDILEQKFDAIVNTVNESLGQLRVELEKTKDTLVNNVEKSVASSCQKTFKEAFLGQNNDDKLTSAVVENKGVAGMMKEIITEQRQIQDKEEQMREDRQKNIIIYKKAEKLCKDAEERKKRNTKRANRDLSNLSCTNLTTGIVSCATPICSAKANAQTRN